MRGLAHRCAHLQVFHDRHAQEDAAAFRRLRDLEPRDLVRGQTRDIPPGERDRALLRAGISADRHHQSRLASTVGADQRYDLALADLDVHAPQGGDVAVIGLDSAHGEERRVHGNVRSTSSAASATSSCSTPR